MLRKHAPWVASLTLGSALVAPTLADEITDWNATALQAVRATSMAPPRAARALAMSHLAMYDAVNSISQTHTAYLSNINAPAGCSREAAAAQAAHDVLVSLIPAQAAAFDAALANSLNGIPNGPAKTDGIGLGGTVASAMLASRAVDGSANNPPYTPGTNPGDWRPTPPGFQPPALPGWGGVTPFGITSGSAYRPPAPPSLSSAQYTAAWQEVRDYGSATSAVRTADQTEIAQFWADGAGTETPPGHWNAIARDVAAQQGNTLEQNARMFALLNMATADAGISAWDAKYTYNHWRPIAGIREADTDGNPATDADPTWTPLLVTPNHPSYTSGHSTFSAASAEILKEFYGTDFISFTADSDALVGVTRSFTSFSQASDESGQSRIYGGIHWQYDNIYGQATGRSVGGFVFANYLLPVPEPSALMLIAAPLAALALRRRN